MKPDIETLEALVQAVANVVAESVEIDLSRYCLPEYVTLMLTPAEYLRLIEQGKLKSSPRIGGSANDENENDLQD